MWQITVFWRLFITNSNTLFPGAEISHEVKTDLHLWRPEFLRIQAGFRTPFQLTETRGFADHFLKLAAWPRGRGRRLIAIRRHARGMQSRPRAVDLSPSTCSRPLSFCSMCYEQLSLSYRPTLQSLTSVIVGEMLRRSETYPRRLVSCRGMKIVYEPLLDGREATVVHAVLVSWQQTSSGHLQWSRWIGFQDRWCFSSVSFLCTRTLRRAASLRAASLRAHGSARCHNNTHAYFVSGWEKEAERDDHFRTAPTENSGPKFKFRLLHSLVKLITFQNFKPKRVNKSEMLQNFSQTQGTVFHSSACISSSEGFFKNRSAHFCGKSPSSGACPSQIAILFSLWLKFLMKWKPTYIYGDLNFSDSQQVFANPFSWRKLEGSLIIFWKFQGRTPQEIWITAIFPARSKVVSYDVLHHR